MFFSYFYTRVIIWQYVPDESKYRGRNRGWLPAQIASYYQARSVDIKMSEKSHLKRSYFCKMIGLFIILKRLPVVAMVKP